jgi:hypothetical protein
MLDITFRELMGRSTQKVCARHRRFGVDKRHHVLQLISEAIGAAGLKKAAPSPKTRGYGLVEQPTVGKGIDRPIWGLNRNDRKPLKPRLSNRTKNLGRGALVSDSFG